VALIVDKQSRKAALSIYSASIRVPGSPALIRFDPDFDKIWLQPRLHILISPGTRLGLAEVKHLVIERGTPGSGYLPTIHPNLERISVVHKPGKRVIGAVGGCPSEGFRLYRVYGSYGRRRLDAKVELARCKAFAEEMWTGAGVRGRVPEVELAAYVYREWL
jgi:hypothetical protein